jgi:hypothetical protein
MLGNPEEVVDLIGYDGFELPTIPEIDEQ